MDPVVKKLVAQSIFPTVSKLVDVSSVEQVVAHLQVDELCSILKCYLKKVKKGVYCLYVPDRGVDRLTPHLVQLLVDFCPVYVYFCLTFGRVFVSLDMLYRLVRGVLVHRMYISKLREAARGLYIFPEVEVEGTAFGLDMSGRVDAVIVKPSRVRIASKKVAITTGQVYILEVKSGRRVTLGALAQALTYRILLGVEAQVCAVAREEAARLRKVREVYTYVKNLIEKIVKTSEPPLDLARRGRCEHCPFRIIRICR